LEPLKFSAGVFFNQPPKMKSKAPTNVHTKALQVIPVVTGSPCAATATTGIATVVTTANHTTANTRIFRIGSFTSFRLTKNISRCTSTRELPAVSGSGLSPIPGLLLQLQVFSAHFSWLCLCSADRTLIPVQSCSLTVLDWRAAKFGVLFPLETFWQSDSKFGSIGLNTLLSCLR